MTTKEARKVLGKLAQGRTDEQVNEDIRTATLMKDLFFGIELFDDLKKVDNTHK